MSIVTSVVRIDGEGGVSDWQQIFVNRDLTELEWAIVELIDPEASMDGNSETDKWLNVGLNPLLEQYLQTLS
ncbi:hypothetical protein D3C75_396250 [compost metagenome]